ncbi:unnamed protein product [Microthlaspi erraticum]|uniref:Uncharacterized protein n=1 Tax=Microthlaspi erraticum TaxID=1685480 RepID=A0A6D2KH47_9BRAS|nr:unnamed protein product [Microthlaspi erraticum]
MVLAPNFAFWSSLVWIVVKAQVNAGQLVLLVNTQLKGEKQGSLKDGLSLGKMLRVKSKDDTKLNFHLPKTELRTQRYPLKS